MRIVLGERGGEFGLGIWQTKQFGGWVGANQAQARPGGPTIWAFLQYKLRTRRCQDVCVYVFDPIGFGMKLDGCVTRTSGSGLAILYNCHFGCAREFLIMLLVL